MGYAAGSRATRGIAVQVFDGDGKTVEGASVAFQLPENGPTGVFSSGSRMELASYRRGRTRFGLGHAVESCHGTT